MRARANSATSRSRPTLILLLVLGSCCALSQAKARRAEMNALADAIVGKASGWLWAQRDKNDGWGNETHRVLLALRLGNFTRDDSGPPAGGPAPEMRLSAKQMELEIVLLLWRHREVGMSPIRLARYTLALNGMCMDPRQFYGHDLIGTLQHHDPASDYEFAFTTLAACSAQAHVRKRQMRRLLDIAHTAEDHNVDTVAMVILMLRCLVQDHRHRNLQHFMRKTSLALAQQQRLDGSFGDLRRTALVMQALEEVENEPAENWNRSAILSWIAARQKPDGSFDSDVKTTAEVILGLAPRGLAGIRAINCGHPPGSKDGGSSAETQQSGGKLTTANAATGELSAPSSPASSPSSPNAARPSSLAPYSPSPPANRQHVSQHVSQATSAPAAAAPVAAAAAASISPSSVVAPTVAASSPSSEAGPGAGSSSSPSAPSSSPGTTQPTSTEKPRPLVNVSYTLWVGSEAEATHQLTIQAPQNESFYDVMQLAAGRSEDFQFSAYEWPNGHYVHTLAGFKEEPMSYHYWLLYRLPSPPDRDSPPGNQLVAPGGVDDLRIAGGEHYLFWYKKL